MGLPSFNMYIEVYGDCPNGFLQHDESCYKFFHSTRATWAEAMVNICCWIHEIIFLKNQKHQDFIPIYFNPYCEFTFLARNQSPKVHVKQTGTKMMEPLVLVQIWVHASFQHSPCRAISTYRPRFILIEQYCDILLFIFLSLVFELLNKSFTKSEELT